MRTAQGQLDSVLGGEKLPGHSDIDDLPFNMSIVKETFRWAPPLPIGTTHRLMEDDVYRGMFIPGGSVLAEDIWWEQFLVAHEGSDADCVRAIYYSETIYPDSHTCNPTQFLNKDGRIVFSVAAPESRIFRSGRR